MHWLFSSKSRYLKSDWNFYNCHYSSPSKLLLPALCRCKRRQSPVDLTRGGTVWCSGSSPTPVLESSVRCRTFRHPQDPRVTNGTKRRCPQLSISYPTHSCFRQQLLQHCSVSQQPLCPRQNHQMWQTWYQLQPVYYFP